MSEPGGIRTPDPRLSALKAPQAYTLGGLHLEGVHRRQTPSGNRHPVCALSRLGYWLKILK